MLAKAMDIELRAIWPLQERKKHGPAIRHLHNAGANRRSGERCSKEKETQSPSRLTSPHAKTLHLLFPSSPSPPHPTLEGDCGELPFPGISLRNSDRGPVSGDASPFEAPQLENDHSKFLAAQRKQGVPK
jgi:hypothetical protein